ncbi:MAG: hypothetical protein FJW14_07430 [Acidimicrobiia bacterium]|nr:hypothetical protein [Acidimicrobiia bacterium]
MLAVVLAGRPVLTQAPGAAHAGAAFQLSTECFACHNGLATPAGEDVSIGVAWRASMMANSSRDPYWHAAVRRETIDHPDAREAIEEECSICHMPMAHTAARAAGGKPEIFAHLPVGADTSEQGLLAADGVSCTLCHQISPERLGTPESFVGGFVIAPPSASGIRAMLGPYEIDRGRTAIMRSSTGLTPTEAQHVRQSELCATCHTLFTTALGPGGKPIGRFPEQVPYLEWRHSAWREERSCQSCHMPAVAEPTRIASVLGEPRERPGRHTFLGGNFFMLRMLNRYRAELGVAALPNELEGAASATLRQLASDTANVAVSGPALAGDRLAFDVTVSNLTGHKFPTGYPSRRAWLHVTVRDANGATVFESGALDPRGAIAGNDNDADADRFEPHHDVITDAGQVQIYEAIMTGAGGAVTTGLLQAVAYAKDNRLLPRGFDKRTADADIAVHGEAAADDDFAGTGDRVSYAVNVAGRQAPFSVDVALRYQPIAFRWAQNLRRYDAPEPARFVGYFDSMAGASSAIIARGTAATAR